MCRLLTSSRGRATAVARIVVPARHGAHDVVERGDDEDDASRRCRSDARARTRAALAAAERLRVTVDADGAVIAREREKSFRERPFLSLTKMEAAQSGSWWWSPPVHCEAHRAHMMAARRCVRMICHGRGAPRATLVTWCAGRLKAVKKAVADDCCESAASVLRRSCTCAG